MAECDRYLPTAEQRALAAALGDALDASLPIGRLHESACESDAAWRELEALGLFSMSRPEEQGGSGLGPVEESLVAFELGRRLASPAVVATLAVGPFVAGNAGAEIIAAAYVEGERTVLIEEPAARRVLVREHDRARLLDYPAQASVLDDTHWAARLFEVSPPPEAGRVLPGTALARLRLLDAAVLAGIAQAALDMGVAYAGFREQFGRPIGGFQAVKHRCADMALSARCARDLVGFAGVALAEARDDAGLLVESALVMAGSAAVENAGRNIQIHGGVGFSDEADPHLLIKRAHLHLAIAGGLDAATDRVGAAPGGAGCCGPSERTA